MPKCLVNLQYNRNYQRYTVNKSSFHIVLGSSIDLYTKGRIFHMYNCHRNKALYRSSISVLCMLMMLLVMLSILVATRLYHLHTNLNRVSDIPRRTCCSRASLVGGKLSIVWFICVNKYLQHLLKILCRQVLSYLRTTKCSIISNSSVKISPYHDSLIKVFVTFKKPVMLSIGLIRPRNYDILSDTGTSKYLI